MTEPGPSDRGGERGRPDGYDDGFDAAREALVWWASAVREPTSSLLGSGAIAVLEDRLGSLLGGHAIALPSGSAAIRLGLTVLGAGPGSRVAVPERDWFGGAALVRSTGATVVTAAGASTGRTGRSVANPVIVVEGGEADRPAATREPGGAVLVDAANLAPAQYRVVAGGRWDALALSFGPGKPIDAGEGGALLVRDRERFTLAVRLSQHPARRLLAGVGVGAEERPLERVHPIAALIALHRLCVPIDDMPAAVGV